MISQLRQCVFRKEEVGVVYYTNYSVEYCIGLLSRKNVYDVFEYSFEIKMESVGEIAFERCNKHLWHGGRSVYQIEFRRNENTVINIEFLMEGIFLPFSTISPTWITEFMEQKLDATGCGGA